MTTHTITRQQLPAPWDQMIARVRGGRLGDRLHDADPHGDALLQARAAWLTSPQRRAKLADALQSRHNVAPGSVARVRRLLADGKGPLYTGEGLGDVVAGLAAELGGRD